MLKKLCILLVVVVVCFSSCSKPAQNIETVQNSEVTLEEKNATLIICGQEPMEEYYAYIDTENDEVFLSLLTIIRGLGGKVEYETQDVAMVELQERSYRLNFNKMKFVSVEDRHDWLMVPPGGHAVSGFPKYSNGDIILDTTRIVSFLSSCGMIVTTDHENSVIEIKPR